MSITEGKSFFGKILLLGEYGILYGGQAFTIPLKRHKGYFDFTRPDDDLHKFAVSSNDSLLKYVDYLRKIGPHQLMCPLDMERFDADLANGLYFNSTIPQGYGVGSSGALVAAVFHKYTGIATQLQDVALQLPDIRMQLATMESYFHGSSSGLDPLSCFVGEPLLVKNTGEIEIKSLPFTEGMGDVDLFLLDSHHIGNTRPLVDWFKKRVTSGEVNISTLHAINDRAIEAMGKMDVGLFFQALYDLSEFQLKNMQPMIPETLVPFWEEGLRSGQYIMKLCGSGGGGYMMGFTKGRKAQSQSLQGNGLDIQFLTF